jgi:hypothetical protein
VARRGWLELEPTRVLAVDARSVLPWYYSYPAAIVHYRISTEGGKSMEPAEEDRTLSVTFADFVRHTE